MSAVGSVFDPNKNREEYWFEHRFGSTNFDDPLLAAIHWERFYATQKQMDFDYGEAGQSSSADYYFDNDPFTEEKVYILKYAGHYFPGSENVIYLINP